MSKTEKARMITSRIMLIAVMLLVIIFLTACDSKMEKGADEYVGKDIKEVTAELEEMGFKSIESEKIEDLTSEGPVAEGSVEKVMIDGKDDFKQGDAFPTDSPVMITYHAIRKLEPPLGAEDIREMECEEISEKFEEQGFINITAEDIYDLDPDETTVDHMSEIMINGKTMFRTTDEFPFDAKIVVQCHYPYAKYNVKLNYVFIPNLIFNKYAIDYSVDGNEAESHSHGNDWTDEIRLKEGKHKLTFVSAEDHSVMGEVSLDVTSDLEAEYELYCHTDNIRVTEKYVDRDIELAEDQLKINCSEANYVGKKYSTVVSDLKKQGFSNIIEKPVYDVWWSEKQVGKTKSVTIDGSREYRRGDIFNKDVKVTVKYRLWEEDDPAVIAEKEKEAEKARRKAVAEITAATKGKTCLQARDAVEKNGYKAKYTFESTRADFTEQITTNPDEELDGFVVTDVANVDPDKKTIELLIASTTVEEQTKSVPAKQVPANSRDTITKTFRSLVDMNIAYCNVTAKKFGFTTKFVNSKEKDVTAKLKAKSKEDKKRYIIDKVRKINFEKKKVSFTVVTKDQIKKRAEKRFAACKGKTLFTALNTADQIRYDYRIVTPSSEHFESRVDSMTDEQLKGYVITKVEKFNHGKSKVKLRADTKAHIAKVKQQRAAKKKKRSATKKSSGRKVWVSRTGKRYHYVKTCSNMRNPSQVTLQQAKSMGLTPCQDCAR